MKSLCPFVAPKTNIRPCSYYIRINKTPELDARDRIKWGEASTPRSSNQEKRFEVNYPRLKAWASL